MRRTLGSRRGLAAASVLLSLASLALLLVVDGAQATGRSVGERTLRRAVSSLTEVDSLAPTALLELKASFQEETSGARESLTVPDFPVQLSLTPEEVAGLTPDELRETLVERSAAAIYEGGMSAFRVPTRRDGSGDPQLFSVPGAVDSGLGFLQKKNHNGLQAAVWALAAICAVLAAYIAVAARGYARLTLIGAALSAAAVPLLALVVGTRLALALAADGTDDYISSELLHLGQDASWLPMRNGIAFAGLGLALLLLGLLGSRLERRLRRPPTLTGEGGAS